MKLGIILFFLFIFSETSFAFSSGGNTKFESFNRTKKELTKIYEKLERKTVYCKAIFEGNKITNLNGFISKNKSSRDNKVEWEHIVPAKKFGINFDEWKNGNSQCLDNRGNKLGNRDCAQKVNKKFRRIQADMHNLFPSIGTVNVLRLNYDFVDNLTNGEVFGSCKIKIYRIGEKVEPPKYVKGTIARTYLYMKQEYPSKIKLTFDEKIRFKKWNNLYPPTNQECKRGILIKQIQGNENKILKKACDKKKGTSVFNNFKSNISNFLK